MLVMALYNIVDTIFIGRCVGTDGIAGVALAFPIQMIVGAIGQMIGIGGASLLSRSLGAKDYDKAGRTMGSVVGAVLVLGGAITLIGYTRLDGMLRLFGATDTLLPYAREYLSIILAGVTLHSMAMALNNMARAEGHAKIAMTTMLVSAGINIVLDALFILVLDMGIRGAAIATLIAQVCAAAFLVLFFRSGKSSLKLKVRLIRLDPVILREVFAIGIASFIRQTAMSVLVILLNHKLGALGGDIAIAVYGVVMRLLMFIFTPLIGVAQGLQPIAGFNFGAKRFTYLKRAILLATAATTVIATSGTLLLTLFPEAFLRLFSHDRELLMQGRTALRYVILAFPLVGINVVGATLFQATGKAMQNLILTLSRQILLLIPLVLILPKFFHLNGIWIAFPISDLLSSVLAVVLVYRSRHLFHLEPAGETAR
ncbi:MATE family efflux transporter [bacterium]|nr:MATE family efflux transporter [bacterium]